MLSLSLRSSPNLFAQTKLIPTWGTKENPYDFPLYWLFNRHPYNGLWNNLRITSYNWVVFCPLYYIYPILYIPYNTNPLYHILYIYHISPYTGPKQPGSLFSLLIPHRRWLTRICFVWQRPSAPATSLVTVVFDRVFDMETIINQMKGTLKLQHAIAVYTFKPF